MNQAEIQPITHLPPQIADLENAAVAEGFRFLTRLISEWQSGANRFDAPGECLMAAYLNERMVGIGGLSVDPYAEASVGRLRRVYVVPSSRGQYVGQRLVSELLVHAGLHFRSVRLNTDTVEGSAFYLRCGFVWVEDGDATHRVELSND
ncbi:GNAT family N-acetyltransferase [Pseudomonas azotoformans]